MHVDVIARSKWEARKSRDECREKEDRRRGGGEVNVKGNAINGFVWSYRLKDGWTRINEQVNEREGERECERRMPLP